MNTTSILSEKFSIETGVYIKGSFKKSANNFNANGTAGKSVVKKEKAIVRNLFETGENNNNLKEKLTYTIKEGDDRRLNKNGVLRVYDIDKPVDIPVGHLLGKWRQSHIGVTLIVLNGQWSIGEEFIKIPMHKQEKGVIIALRMLLKFAMA